MALRRDGPLSPDALAARLGASRTAVLQQLRVLSANGLVERRSMRHGVGRPRHLYDVTNRAQPLFPASYDRLSTSLVEAVLSVGGENLLEQVFEARRQVQVAAVLDRFAARGLLEAPLAERARELAVIQDEQGYVCELVEEDGLRLIEHNCPIHEVATGTASACEAELQMFRDLLGPGVARERHIAAGARCCEYVIAPAPES